MRVHVDRNLCEIHAQCVFAAGEVFSLTEDDELQYEAFPGATYEAAVRQAAIACPVQAITLSGA